MQKPEVAVADVLQQDHPVAQATLWLQVGAAAGI